MNVYDRREPHTFSVAFWADTDRKIPLAPKSEDYPQFNLTGPGGTSITSGKMSRTTQSGVYEYVWTPGDQSPISDDYRMEYFFISSDGRQFTKSESFALKDVEVGVESRDQRILSFFGQPVIVQLAFDSEQTLVQVVALDGHDNPIEGPVVASHTVKDGVHYYRAQLSGGLYQMDSTNVLLWTIQEVQTSIPQFVYQIIDTIGSNTVLQINSVRMLVDKFQKAHDSYQGIRDVEVIESLKRGAEIINSFHPITQWPYSFFRSYGPLLTSHTAASAWWLLNSQYMLENDLEFQFTGQSVSLTYDRKSGISDELARLWTFIEGMLKNKIAIYRKLNGVGHLSTRPMSWRHLTRGMTFSRANHPFGGISQSNQAMLIQMFAGSC